MTSRTVRYLAAALVVLGAVPASGQMLWGDDFENAGVTGSPVGPYVPGVVPSFPAGGPSVNGGWDTWYMNPAAMGAISTTVAHSGVTCLEVGGPGVAASGCDIVQEHSTVTSLAGNPGFYDHAAHGAGGWPGNTPLGAPGLGTWQYRAWNYCPSTFPTGTSSHYFIVNDVLNNSSSGPSRWILQVQFNHVAGTVRDDMRATPGATPIIYNAWVEIVATFDLDNQCASVTYNGHNIGNGPLFPTGWTTPGTPQVANLDLFTVGATSYWDDITLTRIIDGPQFQMNSTAAAATINGLAGTACGFAQTRVPIGGTVTVAVTLAAPAAGHEGIIDTGAPIPLGAPGSIFLSPGRILNVNPFSGNGFFLYGGIAPAFVAHPGGTTSISFVAGGPAFDGCIQYVVADPALLLGYELTQACHLIIY